MFLNFLQSPPLDDDVFMGELGDDFELPYPTNMDKDRPPRRHAEHEVDDEERELGWTGSHFFTSRLNDVSRYCRRLFCLETKKKNPINYF
jgi:hypothetical protein